MTAPTTGTAPGRSRTRFRRSTRRRPAFDLKGAAVVLSIALDAEATAARAELARGDSKAAMLLGFAGTGFSLLAAIGAVISGHLAPVAQIGLWFAVAALAVSVAVLLWVIRPFLPRTGGTGFVAHAASDVDQLLATLSGDQDDPRRQAADVIMLSRLAVAKFRKLRTATHLMYAALAVLVVTLPLGALA
uniref:Pycsar system effector family protein n=1 Tax=Sphaerisporangium sp. CA-236357 TaxID=3240030 RepID=UPI003F496447